MLIPNHPHDERLSALASGDPEAVADLSLSEHVASCQRCTDTVAELGALRASLAELPDLRPHRPLQLLPPVADAPSRVDRVGGWARRFFAPVLTAGAALAMVGLVGTTAPLLGGMAGQAGAPDAGQEAAPTEATDDRSIYGPDVAGGASPTDDATTLSGAGDGAEGEDPDEVAPLQSQESAAPPAEQDGADSQRLSVSEGRPIWPMLLFAGVAIMIAAALMRWILAPRAG